jgi:hypothetical protein
VHSIIIGCKIKTTTAKPEFTNYVCNKEAVDYYGVNQTIDLLQNQETTQKDRDKYFVSVNIKGCKHKYQDDSGAGLTFIPCDKFQKLNISSQFQNSMVTFHSYIGTCFCQMGKSK